MQGDPALLNKYKQSHLESYMEDNQRVAFCPSTPWCGRAIEVRASMQSCLAQQHAGTAYRAGSDHWTRLK